jgi:predicted  nucleic acid-binding Zn-ribbon protein
MFRTNKARKQIEALKHQEKESDRKSEEFVNQKFEELQKQISQLSTEVSHGVEKSTSTYTISLVSMESALQDLREQVAQLREDNLTYRDANEAALHRLQRRRSGEKLVQ